MAPSLLTLKSIRRRSKASFKTEKSATDANDTSSDASNGRTPTSGSLTPPSIVPSVAGQSDPALNHQLSREKLNGDLLTPPVPPIPQFRPPLRSATNGSNRNSVSGMTGLGSPSMGGRGPYPQLPVSPYAPQIDNVRHGAWVSSGTSCTRWWSGPFDSQWPSGPQLGLLRCAEHTPLCPLDSLVFG